MRPDGSPFPEQVANLIKATGKNPAQISRLLIGPHGKPVISERQLQRAQAGTANLSPLAWLFLLQVFCKEARDSMPDTVIYGVPDYH